MTTNSVKPAAIVLICFASGAANAADSVDFEEHVLPLFYQRCFSCHSEKKEEPKGGLKLDSVKTSRESGVIAPGNPDESELLIRISLAHDDDDFMPPPKGGAQPFDEDELAMMKTWIREDASFGDWERFELRQAPLEVAGESLSMDDVPPLSVFHGLPHYGATDEAGERVADKPVTMPDFNATVAQAIGVDLQKNHHSPSGRPFAVTDKGKPIVELFA